MWWIVQSLSTQRERLRDCEGLLISGHPPAKTPSTPRLKWGGKAWPGSSWPCCRFPPGHCSSCSAKPRQDVFYSTRSPSAASSSLPGPTIGMYPPLPSRGFRAVSPLSLSLSGKLDQGCVTPRVFHHDECAVSRITAPEALPLKGAEIAVKTL